MLLKITSFLTVISLWTLTFFDYFFPICLILRDLCIQNQIKPIWKHWLTYFFMFILIRYIKTLLCPGQDVIARFPFFLTKWSFKNKVLADFEIKCDDETQSLKKKENKFLLIILTTLNIYFWTAQTETSLNSYLSFIIFRKQKFFLKAPPLF